MWHVTQFYLDNEPYRDLHFFRKNEIPFVSKITDDFASPSA